MALPCSQSSSRSAHPGERQPSPRITSLLWRAGAEQSDLDEALQADGQTAAPGHVAHGQQHAPNGETIYGPAAVEGTERTLSMSDYVEEFGHVTDRIGKKTGKWFSPVKDGKVYSFEARAVEEACKDLPYNQLAFPQELPDLQVRISQAAPNLGHPGGAIQLQLIQNGKEVSMADLIDLGVSKW